MRNKVRKNFTTCQYAIFATLALGLNGTLVNAKNSIANSQESYSLLSVSEKKITGTILDVNGEPIIGANVIVKGTAKGVITDIDGKFSLEVASGDVLSITYIGFVPQDVKVGNSTSFVITLKEDSQALDEVVVIGYGTTKRKDFTGSVSSIKLEDSPISLTSNMNALESLKGNVAGLDVGATTTTGQTPSLLLRGQKSISGSNEPLIVLDGVIFMGSINDINPNDIASIDVLKDATSAAAYGSRSANGVIIITTKKGKSGKPVITLNASGTMQMWANKPELMNGEQWLETVLARLDNDDLSWMSLQEKANMEAGKEINWLDAVSQTGWLQDYQVAVSGASDRMDYYLSASYSDNQGVIIGDKFNRVAIMAKLNTNITDWLKVGVDFGYTRQHSPGNMADVKTAYRASPYGVMYRDEEKGLLEKYQNTSQLNPLWGVNDGTNEKDALNHNFRANVYALVQCPWVKGLSYRMNFSGYMSRNRSYSFINETFFVPIGNYDDESRYAPETLQNYLASANGTIKNYRNDTWVLDNILNYNQTFGDHTIDLTAVATRDSRSTADDTMVGKDFTANGNTSLGINGLFKATNQTFTQSGNLYRNIGYLGRASYSFADKYYLTGSYRRDGASVFGENQKWGDFYAFGLAWRITQESFMNKTKGFLDNLKLKLSWGKNGNQGIGAYGTLSKVVNGQSGGMRYEFGDSNILYGLNMSSMGNADLGWESTQSWNFGFESAWLNNRIFLDVDAYFSKTTDQLFSRKIPIMTGFGSVTSSMGQINNSGVEINLRTTNIQNKDWYWGSSFTFWLNRNKLVHLYGEDLDGDGKEDDDIANSRFIGKSLGAIYGYKQDGVVQETDIEYMEKNGVAPGTPKYVDLTGEGIITADDRTILGYTVPNFKLNMSNTVSYKNWELYVMMTGTFGGNGYYLLQNQPAYMANFDTYWNANNVYIPWWTPENKSNKYLAPTFKSDGRFLGLQNRGYVRIQDVTLSYTFNQKKLKDLGISNLKVFMSAKNLATFTKWEGLDPELGAPYLSTSAPIMTSCTLGLNMSF
ncbi:TonB-dependent receptor [Bacteroides sp.]|uniref:SusC/RagA family TonB-linked outer membrane protein n=1 Tax=Bacteroides sp. TaxID=29523 RepID=UPI0025896450|nr:TonB-dependent receptor [Bacteroides sp.]